MFPPDCVLNFWIACLLQFTVEHSAKESASDPAVSRVISQWSSKKIQIDEKSFPLKDKLQTNETIVFVAGLCDRFLPVLTNVHGQLNYNSTELTTWLDSAVVLDRRSFLLLRRKSFYTAAEELVREIEGRKWALRSFFISTTSKPPP